MERSKSQQQAEALERQINAMKEKYVEEINYVDSVETIASIASARIAQVVERWPYDETFLAVEAWAEIEGVIDDYAKCRHEVDKFIKKAEFAGTRMKQVVKLKVGDEYIENPDLVEQRKKNKKPAGKRNAATNYGVSRKRTRSSGRLSAANADTIQSSSTTEDTNQALDDTKQNIEIQANESDTIQLEEGILIALTAPRGRQSALDALGNAGRTLKNAARIRAYICRSIERINIIINRIERRSPNRLIRPVIADAAAAFAQKGLDRPDAIEDTMIIWDFISTFRGSKVLPLKTKNDHDIFPQPRLDIFVEALASPLIENAPFNLNNQFRFLPSIHIWLLRLLLEDKRTASWWPKPRQNNYGKAPLWWYSEWHDKILKRDLNENDESNYTTNQAPQEMEIDQQAPNETPKVEPTSQTEIPVEESQSEIPVEESQAEIPIESTPQAEMPVEESQAEMPVEESQTEIPVESTPQAEMPVEESQTEIPVESTPQAEMPVEESQTEIPVESTPQAEMPVEESQTEMPVEESQSEMPVEESQIEIPVESTPVEESQAEMLVEESQSEIPVEDSQAEIPIESTPQAEMPIESTPQAELSDAIEQTSVRLPPVFIEPPKVDVKRKRGRPRLSTLTPFIEPPQPKQEGPPTLPEGPLPFHPGPPPKSYSMTTVELSNEIEEVNTNGNVVPMSIDGEIKNDDDDDLVFQVSALIKAGNEVAQDKLMKAAIAVQAPVLLIQNLSTGSGVAPELIAAIHARASMREEEMRQIPSQEMLTNNKIHRVYAVEHALWAAGQALYLATAEAAVATATYYDTRKWAQFSCDAVILRGKREPKKRKPKEYTAASVRSRRHRKSSESSSISENHNKNKSKKLQIPLKLNELTKLLKADHQRIVPRPSLEHGQSYQIVTPDTWPVLSAAIAARYMDRNRSDDLAYGLDEYDQYEIDLLNNTSTPSVGLSSILRATNAINPETKKPLHCKVALKLAIDHLMAGHPYNTLLPRSRCALLRVLVDAVTESAVLEDEISKRAEQLEAVDTNMFEDTFNRDKSRENGRLLRNATTHRKKVGLFLIRKSETEYEYEQNSHFVMARIPKYEASAKRGLFRLELEMQRDKEILGSSEYNIVDEIPKETTELSIFLKLKKAMQSDSVDQLNKIIESAKQQPELYIPDKFIVRPLLTAMLISFWTERVRNETRAKKQLVSTFRGMPRIRAEQLGRDKSGAMFHAFVGESNYAPHRIWRQLSPDQEVAPREYPYNLRTNDQSEIHNKNSKHKQNNEILDESIKKNNSAAPDNQAMDESDDHNPVQQQVKGRPPTPPPPLINPHVAVHSKSGIPVWGYYGDERTVRQLAASMDQFHRSERALEQELSYRF